MNAARRKVDAEGVCRVCGALNPEAAHIWPRSLGAGGFDWPDLICPLCRSCHVDYDCGQLDLLPHLTLNEQVAVVRIAGIARAYNRLRGAN